LVDDKRPQRWLRAQQGWRKSLGAPRAIDAAQGAAAVRCSLWPVSRLRLTGCCGAKRRRRALPRGVDMWRLHPVLDSAAAFHCAQLKLNRRGRGGAHWRPWQGCAFAALHIEDVPRPTGGEDRNGRKRSAQRPAIPGPPAPASPRTPWQWSSQPRPRQRHP